MLIEFRVENHRSVSEEQALSFEAARSGNPLDSIPRQIQSRKSRILPVTAIYGANASGKSNVLNALAFMREAVLYSQRAWEPDIGVPRTPFAWREKSREPSMFEVTLMNEQVKYTYGFVVDDKCVLEEWLFAWPKNRRQVWFEREAGEFKFGEHLKGPNEAVKEITRSNALFLSSAAQQGHEQLTPLFSWFRRIVTHHRRINRVRFGGSGRFIESVFSNQRQLRLFSDEEYDDLTDRIRQLLVAADVGIVGVKRISGVYEEGGRRIPDSKMMLQHQSGDEDSWLSLEDESEGTKTLFDLAPLIFRTLESGGVILIDELESSLHPLLGLAIVNLFNSEKSNPNNAQLLFTTHDTNLLGTILDEPSLRRDQIWFTEKDERGATRIYPLTDFKPRRAENLERGYLQGRYGAIPFLGDFTKISE